MAPQSFTDDYYAILEVSLRADEAAIRSSYIRLARRKHPDKNGNDPRATAEFQLLQAAYDTLSDPHLRRQFDLQYPNIQTRNHQWESSYSQYDNGGSRAGSSQDHGASGDDAQRRIDELEKQVQQLGTQRRKLEGDRFEGRREVHRTESALDRLQAEQKRDEQDEATRNSWFGLFYRQSAEEKEQRGRDRAGRMTGRIVLEKRLSERKTALIVIESQMSKIDATIEIKRAQKRAASRQLEEARLTAERIRQAEQLRNDLEARKRQEQMRGAFQERERLRREEAERLRREEELARKAEQEAERRRRQEAMRKGGSHRGEGRSKMFREEHQPMKTSNARRGAAEAVCWHNGWWQKTQGRAICQNCHQMQSLFLFCCPGCQIMTCAKCRRILKGQGGK